MGNAKTLEKLIKSSGGVITAKLERVAYGVRYKHQLNLAKVHMPQT